MGSRSRSRCFRGEVELFYQKCPKREDTNLQRQGTKPWVLRGAGFVGAHCWRSPGSAGDSFGSWLCKCSLPLGKSAQVEMLSDSEFANSGIKSCTFWYLEVTELRALEEINRLTGNRQKQLDRSEEPVKPANLQEHQEHSLWLASISLFNTKTKTANLKTSCDYIHKNGILMAWFLKERQDHSATGRKHNRHLIFT